MTSECCEFLKVGECRAVLEKELRLNQEKQKIEAIVHGRILLDFELDLCEKFWKSCPEREDEKTRQLLVT